MNKLQYTTLYLGGIFLGLGFFSGLLSAHRIAMALHAIGVVCFVVSVIAYIYEVVQGMDDEKEIT
jgi:hypothetical protein